MRPDHMAPLANLMARALRGERVRACLSFPPRHSKTETAVVCGVPWYLQQRPDHHIVYCSYAAEFAEKKSEPARDIAQELGIQLSQSSKSKSHWLTRQGGGLQATGIGGPITGHGYDLILVDDPFKSRAEAESPTIREKVFEFFNSTLMTRCEPKTSVIVFMQRWHDDDLIGRLAAQESGRWEIISMPAILDEGTPHERALWPEQWPLELLKEIRAERGPYIWASQFQQQPRPRGGRLFGERAPMVYTDELLAADLPWARGIISCDPALTAKRSADYSAIVVLAQTGVGVKARSYVLDVWRDQVQSTELIRKLAEYQRLWNYPVGVEAVGGFRAIPQILREMHPGMKVLDINPEGDKFTRAQGVAAAWIDGRVLLPEQAPWLRDFAKEVRDFTGVSDVHDDQVDALANGFNELYMPSERPGRGAHEAQNFRLG